ncbi:MAG: JAB domain-containing protein [Candidatus Tectomicrobia bacterium]
MQQSLFVKEAKATSGLALHSMKGIPVYTVKLVRTGQIHYGTLRHSQDAEEIIQRYLEDVDREHFIVLLLDRKNNVTGINTVAIGSLSATVVHPREVFTPAILDKAAAIILAHNHPSGDPAPSPEDKAMTRKLVEAGKILGIQVLDHIIVGDERAYSFADEGCLD